MGIGNFGMWEMLLVGLIVLIFFGPRRLPEIARSAGKAMREFKRGMNEIQRELEIAELEQKKTTQAPAATASTPGADTTTPSIQPPIPTFAGAAAAVTSTRSAKDVTAPDTEVGLYDGTQVDVGGEPKSVERRVESSMPDAQRAPAERDEPGGEGEADEGFDVETGSGAGDENESPRPEAGGSG